MKVSGEMVLYFGEKSDDEHQVSMSLSLVQLETVLTILGITNISEDSMACFSDETLMQLRNMDKNPFKLKMMN